MNHTQETSKGRTLAMHIKSDIVGGVFDPGDLLPTVDELAHEHEVTVSTVYRALGLLEREYMVERSPEGWVVSVRPVPQVRPVRALGYTVVLCKVCGLVWHNRDSVIKARGYDPEVEAADHRDAHVNGWIVMTEESA